jgi:hypothetical protein
MLTILIAPALALGQTPPESDADSLALSPTRFELVMLPGTEKTVIVNIIYRAVTGEAQPSRLVAYLGDWDILSDGKVEFYKPGQQPNSACSWIIYSPAEVTVSPGRVHPLRVTVSVPKDARPGDHLAALMVEPRPDNIRLEENRRQMAVRFRMAAFFYIMVPQLIRKGSLQDLKAAASEQGLIITPRLKNEGNTHLRPTQAVKIIDRAGAVVAELAESQSVPILSGGEISSPLLIDKSVPAGNYTVSYRVDFRDGSAVTEGQTELVVKERLAQPPAGAEKHQDEAANAGESWKHWPILHPPRGGPGQLDWPVRKRF